MSENKFIKHLRGEQTAKSVLELKNQRTNTSFATMPVGTSNANEVYSDHRGNATAVLKGTDNWKLNGLSLVVPTDIYGDGRDVTGTYDVAGQTLWVDASYTFPQAKIFTPNTKWVLKLCGNRLLSGTNDTIPLTLLIKFGTTTVATKVFPIKEHAFNFSEELVVDFAESNTNNIKVAANSTMTVQVLCGDATATAQIYNGMTVFTALQRRVDADVVASDEKTFDEVVDDVEQLQEDLDDLEEYVDETFVKKAGDTMSGALNIANIASSNTPLLTLTHSSTATYKWNIAPRYNSTTLSIYPGNTETNGYRFATTGFVPASNNARYLGSASLKWKGVYTAMINNGGDLAVPANTTGTLATKADVDLAANSGRMITDQGVWYAKMYAATVAPAAEDGTNYADFSQVDGQGNPIIVTYNRVSGAWVQDQTIIPPAEYDGYVPITSKIWDIAEQAGQQGGRILWNHQSKEFTPYPQIVSFEDIEVTGESTVIMPLSPSVNQIVNKNYVDTLVSNSIGDATITLTQGGQTMGSFTTNQNSDVTIALDGGSSYHPDLFDWKWADHQVNDVQWLRADTFSWQSGSVYQAAFDELFYDIQISTYWYGGGGPAYTKSRTPAVGDAVYLNSDLTTQIGTVEAYDDANDEITVSGNTYTFMSNTYVTPTTETVAGYSLSVYTGHSGRKIVSVSDEANVANIYAATGVAWYYIIDIPNKRFKLPRRHSQQIVRSVKNADNSWYRLYADGWVEQGGFVSSVSGERTVNFPITMADTNYTMFKTTHANTSGSPVYNTLSFYNRTTASAKTTTAGADFSWEVIGQSAIDMSPFQDGEKHLYFYVGEFTQTALENTAGLNAELFNDKVDVGHQVIAFQAPTAGNNYTWYRKYADGWVEQGGFIAASAGSTACAITLPIQMSSNVYSAIGQVTESYTGTSSGGINFYDFTTTSMKVNKNNTNRAVWWEVKGMAA